MGKHGEERAKGAWVWKIVAVIIQDNGDKIKEN